MENLIPCKYKTVRDIEKPPRICHYVAKSSCCTKSYKNRLTFFWVGNRDVHGNSIIPFPWDPRWESHGNGTKNLISHGNGNNVDGNGNDPHSHGNPIPMDKWKENRAVLSKLYSIACRILCVSASSAEIKRVFSTAAGYWKNDEQFTLSA